MTEPSYPLEGLKVLDLSQALSGPFAGRMLGDLGADVVKVEWPRGDATNLYGLRRNGISGLFFQVNASKRGIAVNRDVPQGRDLLRELAGRADVVIENFRPGVLDRAGLGYEALSAGNPGLIMLSISGFGRTSPEAQRQAYAPVIHAESGLLARQAALDNREPTDIALALADSVASLHGVVAILAAVVLRQRTGAGQHIDLSMLEAMVATDDYTHYAIEGEEVYAARGEIFDAPGGPVLIAADRKTLWHRVSRHVGLPDPGPTMPPEAAFEARFEAARRWILSFPDRESLIRELEAAQLPWAEVRDTATLLQSPSLQAREVVATVTAHDGEGRGVIRMPYRFSAAVSDVTRGAPARGQHSREVLRDWLGFDDAHVDELTSCGAVVELT